MTAQAVPRYMRALLAGGTAQGHHTGDAMRAFRAAPPAAKDKPHQTLNCPEAIARKEAQSGPLCNTITPTLTRWAMRLCSRRHLLMMMHLRVRAHT